MLGQANKKRKTLSFPFADSFSNQNQLASNLGFLFCSKTKHIYRNGVLASDNE